MPIVSKLTSSYLAGLIDGEGSLEIRKQIRDYGVYYEGRLRIAMTDKKMIDWLKDSFGGYTEHGINNNGSEYYCWVLKNTKNLLPLLSKIRPYLKLKKERADLLILFMKRKISTKRNDGSFEHLPPQENEIREKMFQKMKMLNIKPLHAKRLSEETFRKERSDSPTLQVTGE